MGIELRFTKEDEPCRHCGKWPQELTDEEFRQKVREAIKERTGEPILC